MPSSRMSFDHHDCGVSKTSGKLFVAALLAISGLAAITQPASALNLGPAATLGIQAAINGPQADVIEVRAVARRGGAVVGPRGNVAAYRSRTVVRGPVARPGVRPVARPGVGWARPGLVPLAGRRRGRGRCCDRLRHGRGRSLLCGLGTRTRDVLVLYRSVSHPGLLGLLPALVRMRLPERRHVAGRG
jgi:hypothetical protein